MFDDDPNDNPQHDQGSEDEEKRGSEGVTEAEQTPAEEQPGAEEPVAEGHAVAEEEPGAEDKPGAEDEPGAEDKPGAEDEPGAEEPVAEEPVVAEEEPVAEQDSPRDRSRRGRQRQQEAAEPELIPGAHLEPDLVLDEAADRESFGDRAGAEIQAAEELLAAEDQPPEEPSADTEAGEAPEPMPLTVLDLAADARYRATGKRKSAVARVTLRPGTGVYTVNGRDLDTFFPRPTLQRTARGPLETVAQQDRMDVVAKIHGGGVSAQAGALRHGIARALVEADPNLRGELKRRGFLTRDPRVKERKKAGLKKARKRPQFSKR